MGLHFVPSQPLGFISASFSCKATRLYNPRQAWIAQGEKKNKHRRKKKEKESLVRLRGSSRREADGQRINSPQHCSGYPPAPL